MRSRRWGSLGVERVWDLARTREGILLAATGRRRQGLRPRAQGRRRLDRRLRFERFAGALAGRDARMGSRTPAPGPSGQVVNLTDPKHPASRPDPKVQYIWDLAARRRRATCYAATGPNGQLWKRSADGQWSLLYDSKSTHLLCLAVGPDGSVYAGSDGEGLIYRVSPRRQGDDPLRRPAVRDPHPALGRRRCALRRHGGGSRRRQQRPRARCSWHRAGAPQLLDGPPSDRDGAFPSGSADDDSRSRSAPCRAPPAPPGSRRQPGPAARRRLGLAQADHGRRQRRLPARRRRRSARGAPGQGAGPCARLGRRSADRSAPARKGQLYEVRDRGDETAPIAKLDRGQILSLLAEPDGTVLLGTGDPGAVVRLSPGYTPSGTTGLRGPRHQAGQPIRRAELAGRPAAGHVDRVPGAHGQRGRARRDLVGLVGRADRPRQGLDRLPGRTVRPVSGQARDHRPAALARAAIGCRSATGRPTWRRRSPGSTFPT